MTGSFNHSSRAAAPFAASAALLVAAFAALLLADFSRGSAWGQDLDAASTSSTAALSEETAPGWFEVIFSGGWLGTSIMLTLIALSLTTAYLAFEQALTLRRGDLMPQGLADVVRQHMLQGRLQEAAQACQEKPCMLSFILLSGLSESDGDWAGVEKALEDALAEQSAVLYRKIEYLSVIGNLAPMLGLLGTVTGMLFAFQQVAVSRGSAGASDLADGIYHALVSTVAGLMIAIPALAVFAIFRNRVDQLTAEAAYAAQHSLSPLKRRSSAPPPIKGA